MVNGTTSFEDHIYVANGFARVFKQVFGSECGVGARSAVGMGSLPMNQTVEVEMIVEFDPPPQPASSKSSTWTDSIPELDPVINCCGHFTSLGGSKMRRSCLEAMRIQSQQFVDLNALLLHAGKRISALARAPSGYSAHVTSGASAGIALSVAACMLEGGAARGKEKAKDTTMEEMMASLPDTSGLQRTWVLVDGGSDLRWLPQVELTGARVKIVGGKRTPMTRETMLAAVDEIGGVHRVACVLLFDGSCPSGMGISDVVLVASGQYPVVVDAAARLPPIENLWRIVGEDGADCVLFSGGKAIGGPQSSGFMIGRSRMVEMVARYACPNEVSVCRAMKTTKESVVGLVAALEEFVRDEEEYPERPNRMACVVKESLLSRMTKELVVMVDVRTSTGEEENLVDVQPNGHSLLFVDLSRLPSLEGDGERRAKKSTYGSGVNHGSPLDVRPFDSSTMLASRLCRSEPGLTRVVLNTTSEGVFVNPILLKDEKEARYVGMRIADEMNYLISRRRRSAAKL
jgi:L-seryl-tRNA(Ser) seleniumtransferase